MTTRYFPSALNVAAALMLAATCLPAKAFNCGDDGRTDLVVMALAGLEDLEHWTVEGPEIHPLALPNGLAVGVLVEPLTMSQYRERFPDQSRIWESAKITVFDLSGETPEEIVVGWGGMNSLQRFNMQQFGPGGLNLLLNKAVCVTLDGRKG